MQPVVGIGLKIETFLVEDSLHLGQTKGQGVRIILINSAGTHNADFFVTPDLFIFLNLSNFLRFIENAKKSYDF